MSGGGWAGLGNGEEGEEVGVGPGWGCLIIQEAEWEWNLLSYLRYLCFPVCSRGHALL